jgi:hypothetical protein
MERTPTYGELIKMGLSPEEARKFLMEQKVEVIQRPATSQVVPPLEAYVEGPPEIEISPLREEPVPITKRTTPTEIASIIEHLKADTKEMTQLKVEFPEGVAWVTPIPRYTLFFKKPEGKVVGALHGAKTAEELKEYHKNLELSYPEHRIERHYRADKDVHYFWAFPPERKSIYRRDANGMALEILKLRPTRLSIQHIPRIIQPPKAIPVTELPWRLKLTPAPKHE